MKSSNRTSALCSQYVDMIDILRKFLRAERNWKLTDFGDQRSAFTFVARRSVDSCKFRIDIGLRFCHERKYCWYCLRVHCPVPGYGWHTYKVFKSWTMRESNTCVRFIDCFSRNACTNKEWMNKKRVQIRNGLTKCLYYYGNDEQNACTNKESMNKMPVQIRNDSTKCLYY